jgi:hypothetical protein
LAQKGFFTRTGFLHARLHPHPLRNWRPNRTATSPNLRPQTAFAAAGEVNFAHFSTVPGQGEGLRKAFCQKPWPMKNYSRFGVKSPAMCLFHYASGAEDPIRMSCLFLATLSPAAGLHLWN